MDEIQCSGRLRELELEVLHGRPVPRWHSEPEPKPHRAGPCHRVPAMSTDSLAAHASNAGRCCEEAALACGLCAWSQPGGYL